MSIAQQKIIDTLSKIPTTQLVLLLSPLHGTRLLPVVQLEIVRRQDIANEKKRLEKFKYRSSQEHEEQVVVYK